MTVTGPSVFSAPVTTSNVSFSTRTARNGCPGRELVLSQTTSNIADASSRYIDELERLEEDLKSRPRSHLEHFDGAFADRSPSHTSPEKIHTVVSMGSSSTVARGGGLSFISLLFSDADWRRANADLLRSLARAPRAPDRPVEACSLPPGSVVKALFER